MNATVHDQEPLGGVPCRPTPLLGCMILFVIETLNYLTQNLKSKQMSKVETEMTGERARVGTENLLTAKLLFQCEIEK